MQCDLFPRKAIDWKTLRLRKSTRRFLEFVSSLQFNIDVLYIVLFGSEALGKANVKSDIDLAVVSERPLMTKQRILVDELISGYIGDVDYQLVFTSVDKLLTNHALNVNYNINRQGVILYERIQ